MTTSNHTPGPWRLRRLVNHAGGYYSTIYEAHIEIGDVCMVWAPPGNAEQAANANLIAAAPELLAALESMLEIFEMDLLANTPGTDEYTAVILAREAIKKARE